MVGPVDEGVVRRALEPRLFGYGLLYRAHLGEDGSCEPLAADGDREAGALAAALARLAGISAPPTGPAPEGDDGDTWCLSVPFGRCGLEGRPREHIRLFGASEAYHDTLGPDGYREERLVGDQALVFEPGLLHRLRTRPGPEGRVLVAFQTEDRTPLHGHAAPVSRAGVDAPLEHPERLAGAWGAYEELRRLASTAPEAYLQELQGLMQGMAATLAKAPVIGEIQTEAAAGGAYGAVDQALLFEYQASLLTPQVVDRVGAGDEDLFRFPGMFGAVASLFPLLGDST